MVRQAHRRQAQGRGPANKMSAGPGITSLKTSGHCFRAKKDRPLELKSVFHECEPGRHKIAIKVVDIFGNNAMTIVDINVGGKK
jgi:hypothetical protein